jgi:3-methylcrotonyl-CoA carboxylase alpha subunit
MATTKKQQKISRLLIANRGEIACRIAATCRQMGIEVVTIYAENDASLPHATVGDFAVQLAGEALAETYLNMDRLIEIAKETGADAIHPGYGFLSENAVFSKAVADAGLIFVGPSAAIINDMGDKAASRQLCEKIGVPVVPGFDKQGADEKTLIAEAKKIGFPLMVKASAGGGGKGMRIVTRVEDLADAIARAKSEAKAFFGDDRLIVEKYLVEPRHIEVQVFSDSHGNHLHLFERECSIQRRHQKVIEESPALNLPAKTRQEMFDCAVKLTKHIDYIGAGTVEFIVDNQGAFFFLEMNTRLQVEHPVTEWVTGLDLVRMQLQVAMGEKIPLTQNDISQNGHAIEIRLYAEDAARDFMPSPGNLTRFHLPELPYVRTDTGYVSGNVISASYDPMIAKIISWGDTRTVAIARMEDALMRTEISGVTTNRSYLLRILQHEAFVKAKISTAFIADYKEDLLADNLDADTRAQLAAAYLLLGKGAAKSQQKGADVRIEHSAWTHPKRIVGAA